MSEIKKKVSVEDYQHYLETLKKRAKKKKELKIDQQVRH